MNDKEMKKKLGLSEDVDTNELWDTAYAAGYEWDDEYQRWISSRSTELY